MVGGDLYSGTAGIANVSRAPVGHHARRSPASGRGSGVAARHRPGTRKGRWRVGADPGLGGVLHAAIAVAKACRREEEATVTVQSLVERLSVSRPEDAELDVLDGRAGAVRSLLLCRWTKGSITTGSRWGRPYVFGNHDIVRLAERSGEKWSWNTTKTATTRHLLGYSHGTSGVACALEQLFRVTGERAFRHGADAAWRYETSWFDERERNWPDFRIDDEEAAAPAGSSEPRSDRFACWWCHGAPGTALALARHIALVPEEGRPRLEPLLAASLETTIASVSRPLAPKGGSNDASFCLCHGIAGNADILMQIAHLARSADLHPVVLSAARTGIERHHDSGDWPCGVPGGDRNTRLAPRAGRHRALLPSSARCHGTVAADALRRCDLKAPRGQAVRAEVRLLPARAGGGSANLGDPEPAQPRGGATHGCSPPTDPSSPRGRRERLDLDVQPSLP